MEPRHHVGLLRSGLLRGRGLTRRRRSIRRKSLSPQQTIPFDVTPAWTPGSIITTYLGKLSSIDSRAPNSRSMVSSDRMAWQAWTYILRSPFSATKSTSLPSESPTYTSNPLPSSSVKIMFSMCPGVSSGR